MQVICSKNYFGPPKITKSFSPTKLNLFLERLCIISMYYFSNYEISGHSHILEPNSCLDNKVLNNLTSSD